MKTVDTRITTKKKLTMQEYGEALHQHYKPEAQQSRVDKFYDTMEEIILNRKELGFDYTEIKNLHGAVSVDSDYFEKLLSYIETRLNTKVYYNIEKDEGKITW